MHLSVRAFPSGFLSLDLEAARSSPSTSALEFATLASDVWFLVTVRAKAEVLDGFTSVLRSTEQQSVGASGSTQGKLVEGENLTASLLNSCTGGGSEAKRGDGQLGDSQQTVVVCDSSNNDDGLSLLGLVQVGDDARQGDGGTVDLGHEQSAKDDLVEVGVGTTSKESVQLHQELKVDVFALGRLAVCAAHMMTIQVDTHCS